MDSVKRYLTAALEEIEDGKPVDGLILVIAAIEELADAVDEAVDRTIYAENELSIETIRFLDEGH